MKVLVTGGAGFIASHIVDGLIENGHQVVVVDNLITGTEASINSRAKFVHLDIRDVKFAKLIAQERPEIVNHHAAQTMVRPSVEDPRNDADVNVLGMLNLLEGCVRGGVRKVIFASSGGTIYGTTDKLPIEETQPFNPQSPYGITKTAGELYLRFFASNTSLTYTCLRYANVYGTRDHVSSEHVITVFSELLLRGKTPTIHWDGEQAKDYIYVDDVVRANILAMAHGDNEAYNIGSGQAISVNEIYQRLARIIGLEIRPEYGPRRSGDVRLFYFNCSKAKRELGWEPTVDLSDGLLRTVDWTKKHLDLTLH